VPIYRGDTLILGTRFVIPDPPTPATSGEVAADALAAAERVVASTIMQATTDHDALAYRARTEAMLINAGSTVVDNTDLTATLGDLWDDRKTSGTTQPGFGLSTTFDAFQNGSTNPSTTIYAYTTAVAALAFLDGHEILGGTTQLDRARDLLDTLLTDCWGWSGSSGAWGCVWYSDHANDQTGNLAVNNVNALLLAVLARIDRIDAAAYDATKRGLIETFTAAGEGYNGVPGRWRYYMGASTLNDLTHHSFMIHGVIEAGMTTEAGLALTYLWNNFLGGNGTINTGNGAVMGSTNWGPGDALIALSLDPTWEAEARILAAELADSVDVNGISSYAIAGNARSVCRYGLGCATYAASILGDGSLFP
jgi:hypothetical protein